MSIRVTVWNEFRHEKTDQEVAKIYPEGIHGAVKALLSDDADLDVRCAVLDDPHQGLTDEVLNSTDVLIWWGHMCHGEVNDDTVEKIRARVYAGMGFIALHSGHHSKPFKAILGTTGNLVWGREQRGIVWNLMPNHPIAKNIPSHFDITEEMYGEPFFIPVPDELLFGTWYEDGNIFRGGCTFYRGLGKIFYFHPGHETCRSFYNPYVKQIIKNAVYWAAPCETGTGLENVCIHQTEAPFKA